MKKACMSWTSFFQSFVLLPVHSLIKSNATKAWHKRCEFCVSDETKWLSHLPFCNIIEEDENHTLISCPRYHQPRTELQEETKSLLLRDEDHHLLYDQPHIGRFGGFVRKIFSMRFPKTTKRNPRWQDSATNAKRLFWFFLFGFLFCFGCVFYLSFHIKPDNFGLLTSSLFS